MRIIRFIDEYGRECLGTDSAGDTAELLAGDVFGELQRTGRRVAVQMLLAPVSPPNIFGIGLNYREHARLLGNTSMPEHPVAFMKPTTSIAHPGQPILLPEYRMNAPEVDYECELAVIIGRTARGVAEREALSYVLGYTAANDITARNWAKSSRTRGKSFDRFCPLGPTLVTADEIPNPQCLALKTTLNGVVVQQGNTEDMIFSVAELVSFLSRNTTLLPGTLILTGTPPGSGVTRDPPTYLKSGDRVCVHVGQIGCLENPVLPS